ncbi:MAG TPA: DoxX family protein [Noviherbaspirillum sp.]|jgi:putative oxidoreductase
MQTNDDLGKLVLRATLAILILFHGVSKLITGVDPIMGMLTKAGLPAGLAFLVYVGEVIAPLMILFGIWARLGAVIVAINMIVAVALAHGAQFFTMGKTGGWALELQGFYFFTALAVALLGAGRYSMGGISGRWN